MTSPPRQRCWPRASTRRKTAHPSTKFAGLLKAEHFYSTPNRRFYQAITELHRGDETVDVVTVAGRLRSSNRMRETGGAAYLADIFGSTPATAHVALHALLVLECWKRRELRRAAEG